MPDGSEPPLGDALRDRICKQFLKETKTTDPLAWVAELAISATDMSEVQDFIARQFQSIAPADFHFLIPTFRWRGIATTNFDRMIEEVYERAESPVQTVVPFLSNSDRVDQKIRGSNGLALLKLHGCVTRTHDEGLPLILTADQYVSYRNNRTRLFSMFEEWASENSVIFVGHQVQDPNLRAILLGLSKCLGPRPRYYIVRPGIGNVEKDFWTGKNISVLDGTFEEFLKGLDATIDKKDRGLSVLMKTDHPIRRWFAVPDDPSRSLLAFLQHDVEYVHEGLAIEAGDPKKFYRGFGLGWYPIANNLDVRRHLVDQLIEDIILRPELDRPSQVELYAVKAEAGAGKSVLLRRVAWDSAVQAGVLCLVSRDSSSLNFQALKELATATKKRIFLFYDNAADHVAEIRALLDFARTRKIQLTVITAERINEWNINCDSLEECLSDKYQLHYLSESEIRLLVDLLETHDALGPNLTAKTQEKRVAEFVKRAGRQLLVALHEATLGQPFKEILLNEYEQIAPAEAQRLYLTVCVLNRMKVPVRAGLISRIHKIPFENFSRRLFAPLEHVVLVTKLPWGDFGYIARHSEIAQIVFERVLTDPTDRFNEYIRIVGSLNPMYSVDLEALRGMLKSKTVLELFPDFDDAQAIYEKAQEVIRDDAYLLQQRGNYERIRPGGDLRLADSILEQARKFNPRDISIVHTQAEVYRSRANTAGHPLERTRLRAEAMSLLRTIDLNSPSARYAAVTQIKLATDSIRDLLHQDDVIDRDIDEAIRIAEKAIESARQRFPGDQHVSLAESNLANLLRDSARSFEALERARTANPRDPFIASRLATLLIEKDDVDKARSYLEEALESNPGDPRLNFQLAELLRAGSITDSDKLIYYYHRSFVQGDDNYLSQFWFARFAFESQRKEYREEAREVFRQLRDTPMSHGDRIRVRDIVGGFDSPKTFFGAVIRVEAKHGFVSIDGSGESIFFHQTQVCGDSIWDRLYSGTRVVFSLGFTFRGPLAVDICLEDGTG